jgi:O-antigen/teichoic acid export membrane protein
MLNYCLHRARRVRALTARRDTADRGIPSIGQTSAANLAIISFGAMAGVIAARALGPHGRGIYSITTVAPMFIGIAGTFGVEEAIVYIAGRASDQREASRMVWGSLALALIMGVVASSVSVAFQLTVFWHAGLGVSEPLFIVAACLPLQYVLSQVSLAHLRVQSRYTAWNSLRLLVAVVYLTGMAIAALAGVLTVDGAILCFIIANSTVLAASMLAIGLRRKPSMSGADIKSMLSSGWKNHLVTVQTYANQQLDQVFLAAMVPAVELGQYAIAVTYASAGLSLGLAPALQMYSHFSRQDKPDREAYRQVVMRTLILLTVSCVIWGALAPTIIPFVFGKSYEMAVKPALILIVSSPVLSLNAMFSAVWKSAGKPLEAAKAQSIGLLLTVICLPVAISYLGIIGAAIVSVIAYAVTAAWLFNSKPFDGLLAARSGPVHPEVTEARVVGENA